QALDHEALNMAAATLYRERFGDTPGVVYAAGVDHAYNLATAFRAAGLKAEAVSGRTPPVKLAEVLAAYERGEIDVLINAMLLAEGWNSPRATVIMHLAPTASKRVYQQRIGRIMRIHPRKEAGIVYAAGVDHAYNLATAFRAAGIKAEAVSGRTPPVKLAEILAAYERAEIDVLINAMLLAEGWNSPRATIVMHLAPTASKRVYQQRIGRIMRIHPRKEAGIVVDFTPKAATHNERVVSLHSLLDADFYREGARVTPAPRRRTQRRARRKLTPASWLVPVTPDVLRRKVVIAREWQRVDPKFLDEDEQEFWGEIAGRQLRFDERAAFVEKLTARGASKRAMEKFLSTCAAQNPNRRLRLIALADRVSMKVERADFDDLVTLVTQAPPWEKDRAAGVRTMLRAIADGKADAPDQILARWTWKLSRAVRKQLDRKASQEYPDAKRLLGALANSRGHRHEENAAKLVNAALEMPREVGAALLASAEGYTPRSTQLLDAARERLGTIQEVAGWIADNLPQPKTGPSRARRRRRRKKKTGTEGTGGATQVAAAGAPPAEGGGEGEPAPAKKRRRRRRKPPEAGTGVEAASANGAAAEPPAPATAATQAPEQAAPLEQAAAPAERAVPTEDAA
ncbi:MAG TPA: helicase-related protein, partial [Thermoleophilaceae bacterium]|nr:helicase-related protein [Thermoleophilaceae bacterium]